jgi:hypothetical protein
MAKIGVRAFAKRANAAGHFIPELALQTLRLNI